MSYLIPLKAVLDSLPETDLYKATRFYVQSAVQAVEKIDATFAAAEATLRVDLSDPSVSLNTQPSRPQEGDEVGWKAYRSALVKYRKAARMAQVVLPWLPEEITAAEEHIRWRGHPTREAARAAGAIRPSIEDRQMAKREAAWKDILRRHGKYRYGSDGVLDACLSDENDRWLNTGLTAERLPEFCIEESVRSTELNLSFAKHDPHLIQSRYDAEVKCLAALRARLAEIQAVAPPKPEPTRAALRPNYLPDWVEAPDGGKPAKQTTRKDELLTDTATKPEPIKAAWPWPKPSPQHRARPTRKDELDEELLAWVRAWHENPTVPSVIDEGYVWVPERFLPKPKANADRFVRLSVKKDFDFTDRDLKHLSGPWRGFPVDKAKVSG